MILAMSFSTPRVRWNPSIVVHSSRAGQRPPGGWIALNHAVKVTRLLCLLWQLGAFSRVGIGERTADLVARRVIADLFKQTPPDYLESFLWGHCFPERLHTIKDR